MRSQNNFGSCKGGVKYKNKNTAKLRCTTDIAQVKPWPANCVLYLLLLPTPSAIAKKGEGAFDGAEMQCLTW